MADTRGIRELAAKEAIKLSDLITCTHEGCKTISILRANIMRLGADEMAAFAESIVEQCCKDVCVACRTGARLIRTDAGNYTHEEGYCVAAAIRSRWQRGEGPNA